MFLLKVQLLLTSLPVLQSVRWQEARIDGHVSHASADTDVHTYTRLSSCNTQQKRSALSVKLLIIWSRSGFATVCLWLEALKKEVTVTLLLLIFWSLWGLLLLFFIVSLVWLRAFFAHSYFYNIHHDINGLHFWRLTVA